MLQKNKNVKLNFAREEDELILQRSLFLCFFILFYQYFQQYKSASLYIISLILTGIAAISSIVGILQYIRIEESDNSFPVTSVFDNPAGIASMLAMTLPFTFYLFNTKLKNNNTPKNIIIILIIALICIVVIISGSRSGILSILLILLLASPFVLKKKKALLILILLPLFLSLYIYKKDSADGRLFIWSNTTNVIKDNLLGVGYNGFTKEYMTYQAQYFKSNIQNDKTSMIASNMKSPMNEYFSFALSWGIIGVIFISIILIYSYYIYQSNCK